MYFEPGTWLDAKNTRVSKTDKSSHRAYSLMREIEFKQVIIYVISVSETPYKEHIKPNLKVQERLRRSHFKKEIYKLIQTLSEEIGRNTSTVIL